MTLDIRDRGVPSVRFVRFVRDALQVLLQLSILLVLALSGAGCNGVTTAFVTTSIRPFSVSASSSASNLAFTSNSNGLASDSTRDTPSLLTTHHYHRHCHRHRHRHGQTVLVLSSSLSPIEIDMNDQRSIITTASSPTTLTSTSTSTSKTTSIHLISLPPLSEETSPKIIKDVWKWKDIVLGDGRDYFIPRPRALRALSEILIGSSIFQSNNVDYNVHDDVHDDDNNNNIDDINGNSIMNGVIIGERSHVIEECAILSNCARMDILLSVSTELTIHTTNNDVAVVTSDDNTDDNSNDNADDNADDNAIAKERIQQLTEEASQLLVATCLLDQLSCYQQAKKEKGSSATIWEGISSFLDLPGMVIVNNKDIDDNDDDNDDDNGIGDSNNIKTDNVSNDNDNKINNNSNKRININEIKDAYKDLGNLMNSKSNLNEIINHFCLVASGLAKRDSRPGRTITFRPFSSRDAHIMLQLKRTVEVANIYPKVKIILDSALNAGKAARDVNKVPILKELKKYDCEGKYSLPAPKDLALQAIRDVQMMAIQPAIDKCLNNLKAKENSERIFYFKNQVDEIVSNSSNSSSSSRKKGASTSSGVGGGGRSNQMIKKVTHDTIMQLRDGRDVDLEKVLMEINSELSSSQ